jgi:regulator of protease activity HflC (stomatin/prohibitin superfamily)
MRICSLFLILTLFSCSAKYHYRKALKKGLQVVQTSDTIRITTIDSVPVIKHDTIVYEHFYTQKDTIVFYKNVEIPKTRLETRIEYKLKRDTIRMITRVEVQKAKADAKTNRKPNYWLLLVSVCVLGFLMYVGGKVVNKYL